MRLIYTIMTEKELGNWKANIFSLQDQAWKIIVNSAPFGLYRNTTDNNFVRIVCPGKPNDPVCPFLYVCMYLCMYI